MMVRIFEVVAKQLTNKAAAGDYRAMKLIVGLTASPDWKTASAESNPHNVDSPRERLKARMDQLRAI
jgi:hypothetical protein